MSQNKIEFLKQNEKWGEFSNYYPAEIKVRIPALLNANGEVVHEKGYLTRELEFSTSEALFQALKFTQEKNEKPDLIEQISKMDAKNSKSFANSNNYTLFGWWKGTSHKIPGYNVIAMRWAVREKFKQNPDLQKKLVDTGGETLIENTKIASYSDDFWGNGWSGNGQNWLGRILMDIRTELQKKAGWTPPTTPPKSPQENSSPTPSNSPDSNPSSSDQTNNEGNNNQSPGTDQPVGNNPPTDNGNSDKENNDGSPSKNSDNPEKLEPPTTDTSPINIDRINNTETLEKAQQTALQEIQELFVKSKVSPNELDESLWKNKSDWKEYLKELKTRQEIAEFAQLLERKIKEKKQLKRKTTSIRPNKSNPSNKALILSLGGGTLLVTFIIVFIVKTKFKKRKLNKGTP